jgi:hypothetical protein
VADGGTKYEVEAGLKPTDGHMYVVDEGLGGARPPIAADASFESQAGSSGHTTAAPKAPSNGVLADSASTTQVSGAGVWADTEPAPTRNTIPFLRNRSWTSVTGVGGDTEPAPPGATAPLLSNKRWSSATGVGADTAPAPAGATSLLLNTSRWTSATGVDAGTEAAPAETTAPLLNTRHWTSLPSTTGPDTDPATATTPAPMLSNKSWVTPLPGAAAANADTDSVRGTAPALLNKTHWTPVSTTVVSTPGPYADSATAIAPSPKLNKSWNADTEPAGEAATALLLKNRHWTPISTTTDSVSGANVTADSKPATGTALAPGLKVRRPNPAANPTAASQSQPALGASGGNATSANSTNSSRLLLRPSNASRTAT